MHRGVVWLAFVALIALGATASPTTQATPAASASAPAAAPPELAAYKQEVATSIDGMYDLAQQMVDSVFSFGEIGFQEFETERYLTGILEREGFTLERGVAGVPTAWTARFGSGKPVIALGSDIDGIPQASQKPGVAYRDPIVDGAPGHGEGHNSGVPLNIVAAIAVKRIMQRRSSPGRWSCGRASPRSCSRRRRTTSGPGCSRTWMSSSTTTSAPTSPPAGETAPGTGWCRWSTPSRVSRRTAGLRRGADGARWTRWS